MKFILLYFILILNISCSFAQEDNIFLEDSAKQYVKYSIERLKNTEEILERLAQKLAAEHYTSTKEDYIKAHYQYESIRPLVLLTPNLNNLVDTHLDQLPKDTQSLNFLGFHAIEYSLFIEQDPTRAFVETQKLINNLRFVITMIQQQTITPQNMIDFLPVYMHQIVEHKLSGYDSIYSESALGEIAANMEGIHLIIEQIHNFLPTHLVSALNQSEDNIEQILQRYKFEDIYLPYDQLTATDKALLAKEAQAFSELLTQLHTIITQQLSEIDALN